LEFLGDSVLGLVAGHYLFLHYPSLGEGALTQLRAALVRRDSLARAAHEINLGVSVKLSRAEERRGGRERESILADAFEAVMGAVFLDGGLEAATMVLERLLLSRADALHKSGDYINPKNLLQELVQESGVRIPPDYRVISTEGPPHHRTFAVEVAIADRVLGRGKAQNKRAAEVEAARDAMRQISAESRIIVEIAGTTPGRPQKPPDLSAEPPNLDRPSTTGLQGPNDGAERKK
jgi:ribonuclease-3